MIYLDSSVALARLLFESRSPPERLWRDELVSSELLKYEVWNRIHAYGLTDTHHLAAERILELVDMIEMTDLVLARALAPFPNRVRTLDGLHLATAEYLHRQTGTLELASYDGRLADAARALAIPLFPL